MAPPISPPRLPTRSPTGGGAFVRPRPHLAHPIRHRASWSRERAAGGRDHLGPAHAVPQTPPKPPRRGGGGGTRWAGPGRGLGGAGPRRPASRGRAPADPLLLGLIGARRAGGCNSDRRFHHQPGRIPTLPGPDRPRLCGAVPPRPQHPHADSVPHTGLCPGLSSCPYTPASIRASVPLLPAPGVHLPPGRSPGPTASSQTLWASLSALPRTTLIFSKGLTVGGG